MNAAAPMTGSRAHGPESECSALQYPPLPMVRIDGLCFGYGETALFEDFDFEVSPGEFVAVLGASGSGKSTLLRLISGLLRPSAGMVRVRAMAEAAARAQALVFQDPRLLPWRRVWGNVEFGLEGLGLDQAERRSRAALALGMVGLTDFAERWPHQLSGGQRQRVGLARALAVRPQLLLMDEPFAALDPSARRALQDLTLDLWRRSGTSVVFVTHDVAEALHLADRIVVLDGAPVGVIHQMNVDLPHPRSRSTAEIRTAVLALHQMIGSSVDADFDQ